MLRNLNRNTGIWQSPRRLWLSNSIKKGKTCNAIACHFGVNIRTIFRIKKAGERIRKTVEITMNKSAKRIISPRNMPFFLMKSALITWIEICLTNNMKLDWKTIKTNDKDLYEYLSGNTINDSQVSKENITKVPESKNTNVMKFNKRFSTSKVWLSRFRKRYGLQGTKLIENDTSN